MGEPGLRSVRFAVALQAFSKGPGDCKAGIDFDNLVLILMLVLIGTTFMCQRPEEKQTDMEIKLLGSLTTHQHLSENVNFLYHP